jgi:MSHA pilin protein MshD
MTTSRCQQGATLIEMVISIVIISIAVTSVMMVVVRVAASSADPIRRIQAMAIAESYMDEILAQSLVDPDGAETGAAEAGEVRANFDDIADYQGLNDSNGARNQVGAPIAGLEGYNVRVMLTGTTLGGHPAQRITVTVSVDGDPDFAIPLVGYRMN